MLESAIQRKIILELEKSGWLVVKLIQTNKNGIMDLMALRNGEAVFLEVKSENGKQSELQKYRQKQIEEKGFQVIVTNSITQIKNLL